MPPSTVAALESLSPGGTESTKKSSTDAPQPSILSEAWLQLLSVVAFGSPVEENDGYNSVNISEESSMRR